MGESLKDVIAKIKAGQNLKISKTEEKAKPLPEAEEVEQTIKKEVKKAEPVREEPLNPVDEELRLLADESIYRREVLVKLNKISESLELMALVISKLGE